MKRHVFGTLVAAAAAATCAITAGCVDDGVDIAVDIDSAELEATISCACDGGWDYWGNPIPVETTTCGTSACGLDGKKYACSQGGWVVTSTSACQYSTAPLNTKFGVNTASTVPGTGDNAARARKAKTSDLGMGHYLEIAFNEGEKYAAASSVQDAINRGVIPIVRICTGSQCGFQQSAAYVRFLNHIHDNVNGTFYAIAGPNEPLSEKWIPGTENVQWNGWYTNAQLNTLGYYNARYMNEVIAGVGSRNALLGGRMALLSPAYNCTHPQMNPFIGYMNSNQANWTGLRGVAGNSYNVNTPAGLTVTKYVNDCRWAFQSRGINAPYDHFIITEMGAFESARNPASNVKLPHSTALFYLRQQVDALRTNRSVRGGLFFNAYGLGSSDFYYGVIADSEWNSVIGPPPAECACNPGIDNFCLLSPSTPSCPMTNRYGYCDPNGNGTFDDADWAGGWYDYQATCN